MLVIDTAREGDVLWLVFTGAVDERATFDVSLSPLPKVVHVNLRNVSHINSYGTRLWRNFFHKLRVEAVKIQFAEITPSLVDMMNCMPGIVELDEVESVCAPYQCLTCLTQFEVAVGRSDLSWYKDKPPQAPCPKCGGKADFDDDADGYFEFASKL